MTINRTLLWWQCRQLLPVTVLAALMVVWHVVFTRQLLLWQSDVLAVLFMTFHGWWLVLSVGRPTSGGVAFLYGHGFDRDTLWKHTMLASGLAVAAIWVPLAFSVWSGLRITVQAWWFNNPEFSLMASREWSYPWFVLLGYSVWVPMLHYAWIREAQPFRGGNSGHWLAVALVIACLTIGTVAPPRYSPPWMIRAYAGSAVMLSSLLIIAGWRLHRDVEVRA